MSKQVVFPPNRIEYFGTLGLVNPFLPKISGNRKAMDASHWYQGVSPYQSDAPYVQTGLESQIDSFSISMPDNASVEAIFSNGFNNNSRTIIFRNQTNGEYDCIEVNEYQTKHQLYGAKYELTKELKGLREHSFVPKGTILAKSPNVKEGGVFSNTVIANTVNLGLACVILDGYGASKSFCERAGLLEMLVADGSCGKRRYWKNIYGDEHNYKPFPEIGDKIRDDGVIFAFCEYNDLFDVAEMDAKSLMEIDYTTDTLIHAKTNMAGGEVYDIVVESTENESREKFRTTPGMAGLANRYIGLSRKYYNSILNWYDKLMRDNQYSDVVLSPGLTSLVARCFASEPNSKRSRMLSGTVVNRAYKKRPLDEFFVQVFVKKRTPLELGYKIAGLHGDK